MAVFVSVSDESYDADNFFYSGWAATVDVWEHDFTPAWSERVLDGPPRIPYLHMTEIRDWNWQAEHGLTLHQAEGRIDEAARVIRSTGGLCPVSFGLDKSEYDAIIRSPFRRRLDNLEPDYLCFQWFAFTQIDWLYHWYGDEVERVDFWVEENGRITKRMETFHEQLADGLRYIGREHLAQLVGRFRPVEKEQITAQASDMLAWHARNARRGTLDITGSRRYWKMTEGGSGTSRGRFGHRGTMNKDDMIRLADRFSARIAEEEREKHQKNNEQSA